MENRLEYRVNQGGGVVCDVRADEQSGSDSIVNCGSPRRACLVQYSTWAIHW
jgi:hypothetical protein